MISNALGSCRRVLTSEYYIANLLVMASYALLRYRYIDTVVEIDAINLNSLLDGQRRSPYQTWEWQVGTACLATAAFRMYRTSTSVDAACSSATGYTQLFIAVMAFLVNKVIFVHYLLAFGLIYLLLEQPQYQGKCHVETLNPVTLKEKAQDPNTAEQGTAYLVFLHAPWSLPSRHAYTTFAELSAWYATDRLNFAMLDVGDWPNVAQRLGIEVSATSSQMPTIILFENGQEQARVPSRSGSKGQELSRSHIIRAFELDMRLATSLKQQHQDTDATSK